MTFAVPISFFKSISMIFGGAGLIFEGLTNGGGCGKEKFCQGLPGVNPQRSNQSVLRRNFFWEMLFQKETGTALGWKAWALSLWPCAFGSHIAFLGTAIPAPPKTWRKY